MPATIDATVGGPSANSYVTLEQAVSYFETRLHVEVWDDADEDTRNKALIWAARVIDRTIRWNGSKASVSQAMQWPRTGLSYDDGSEVPSNEIPQEIKEAQYELSMLLMTTDRTLDNEAAAAGLKGLSAGPVSLQFRDDLSMATQAVPATIMQGFPMSWMWRAVPYPLVVS